MVLLAVPFIKHVRCLGLYVRSKSYSGQYIFFPRDLLTLRNFDGRHKSNFRLNKLEHNNYEFICINILSRSSRGHSHCQEIFIIMTRIILQT